MSDVAIRVENLGKLYRLGVGGRAALPYRTLRDSLADALAAPLRWSGAAFRRGKLPTPPRNETIWALRDVSFEVRPGEVVGIIGRNGAGKTTLLKILSRITEPTEGRAQIRGRVGSLLEVGTGFHPELTGRENIYLNGAILGMSKREIERRFDEIVAFAETEKFLNTPVKRYSSGMYVRLAFAVAAHLDPEVLMVDEVLAVGDAAFQKKCLNKMDNVARGGRTVLFVSHNMGAMRSLAENCIYLTGGRVAADGKTGQVIERYLGDTLVHANDADNLTFYRRDPIGDAAVVLTGIRVNGFSGKLPILEMGSPFLLSIEMEARKKIHGGVVTAIVKDAQGRRVVVFFSGDSDFRVFLPPGKHVVQLRVTDLPLAPGLYFVEAGVNQSTDTIAYDVVIDYPLFEVRHSARAVQWLDRPWGSEHWDHVTWTLAR